MNTYEPHMNQLEVMLQESLRHCLHANEAQPKVLNPNRYREMLEAREILQYLLQKSFQDVQTTIKFFPAFFSASLSAEVDSFEVCDKAAFAQLLELADNFEFVPLVDDRLRVAFYFRNMMIAVDQEGK